LGISWKNALNKSGNVEIGITLGMVSRSYPQRDGKLWILSPMKFAQTGRALWREIFYYKFLVVRPRGHVDKTGNSLWITQKLPGTRGNCPQDFHVDSTLILKVD
jgi:hypothetical protein